MMRRIIRNIVLRTVFTKNEQTAMRTLSDIYIGSINKAGVKTEQDKLIMETLKSCKEKLS